MIKPTKETSNLLCLVDKLIRDIVLERVDTKEVSNILTSIYQPFLSIYDPDLNYVTTIDAFIGSAYVATGSLLAEELIWDWERTNHFIDLVLDFYSQDIIKFNKGFIHQKRKNSIALFNYINSLFNHYSKLSVVRIDLGYLKDLIDEIDIYEFNDHIKKLLELISNKKTCFRHLEGYAWALEQGFDRGFHCHLLLIYQGNKRQHDTYWGQKVGEKWQQITNGLGSYFNCNDPNYKKRFADRNQLGLGMVRKDRPANNVTAEKAINMALYLTKTNKVNQTLRVKVQGMRTFGHGQYRTSKRRKYSPKLK